MSTIALLLCATGCSCSDGEGDNQGGSAGDSGAARGGGGQSNGGDGSLGGSAGRGGVTQDGTGGGGNNGGLGGSGAGGSNGGGGGADGRDAMTPPADGSSGSDARKDHDVADAAPAKPCEGTVVHAGDDLRALAQSKPEGTTFCLKAGVYRGVSVVPKANQKFIGEPGAVLNGSRLLTGFTRDGNAWKVGGQMQSGQRIADCATGDCLCISGRPRCTYPEDLYLDDETLVHVGDRASVGPGRYYFDYNSHTIFMGDDPTGHRVETSITRNAFAVQEGGNGFGPDIPGVVIEGLVIEKYAIPANMSAIGDQYPSPEWTIRNNELRLNHSSGVQAGSRSLVIGNHTHHNGLQGMQAQGDSITFENNETDHNNVAGFSTSWGGGAGKFAVTKNLVVRGNHAHDNYGFGLWTDIENIGTLYENNVSENNDGPGIMHEISFDAIIRNNTLRGNGRQGGYVYSAGILISSSANVEVYGNTIEVSPPSGQQDVSPTTRHGITILQDNRGDSNMYHRPYAAENNNVHDNTIVYLDHQKFLAAGQGSSGSGEFSGGNSQSMKNNRFDHNTYKAPDCNEPRWFWVTNNDTGPGSGPNFGFAAFQTFGQEKNGTCSQ